MPKSGGKKLFVSKCGSKCGVKWKCGVKTLRRQNVASGTNVVAPPKWWKCGFKQCGVEMWRQAHIWWRLRKWPKCGVKQCGVRHKCGGSPKCGVNAASKCGVRHKCGGSPKCGVKQCGVKMWRQTLPLPNCFPGNVSSKKVFSGRHKSATLNACALHFVKHHVVHDAIGTIIDGMSQHVEL